MAININIEDIIENHVIESSRIEYKKGYNRNAIIRTICAFANDIQNDGGGYILIGIDEKII